MVAKHTAGPWFLEGNWEDDESKPLGGWVSSFFPSGSPVFELVPVVGARAEIIANARLVAAAPELLAALEWYGEQARLARLITSEGDAGRHAIARDGGELARSLLAKVDGAA